MKIPDFMNVVAWILTLGLAALVVVGVGFGGYAIYASARANGEVDYCYVEMWSPGNMSPQYMLHAHRPWRSDLVVGNYPTVDDAKAKSDIMHCPMGKP